MVEATAMPLIGLAQMNSGETSIAGFDSQREAIGRMPNSTARVDAMNELAWAYALTHTPLAFSLSFDALRLAQKLDYPHGLAYSHRTLAYCHMLFSNYTQAIDDCQGAIALFEQAGDAAGRATVLDVFSQVHFRIGNYDTALAFALESVELNRTLVNRLGEAWGHKNAGMILLEIGDTTQALETLQQALQLFRGLGHKIGESETLSIVGSLHQRLGQTDAALAHHLRCLALQEQLHIPTGVHRTLVEIGLLHQQRGDLDEALACFKKSLDTCASLDSPNAEATSHLRIGKVLCERLEAGSALDHLQKALAIVEQHEAPPTAAQIHAALAEHYEKCGDFRQALQHHRLYASLRQEIFGEETQSRLKNVELRFAIEKAERDAEIHRLQNVELTAALENLKQARRQLIDSEKMASLGQLVANMGHEIGSPLQRILHAGQQIDEVLRQLQAESEPAPARDPVSATQRQAAIALLGLTTAQSQAAAKIAENVRNLMAYARMEDAEAQHIDVHVCIRTTLAVLSHRLQTGIRVVTEFAELPLIECHPKELNQVFMTLLRNAIDVLNGHGEIRIRTVMDRNRVRVEIEDNGPGISARRLATLFDVDFRQTSEGVRMRVGLANCRRIVEKHSGEIQVTSTPAQGTTFRIWLPVR